MKILLFIVKSFLFTDTMDNWDEEKLQEVVNKKHGEANENQTKTDIVRVCSTLY